MNDSITTPEENFKTFCSFLGIGNVNSKVWFVGIEEGGEAILDKQDLLKQLQACESETNTKYVDEVNCTSPVWHTFAFLMDKYSNGCNGTFKQKMFSKEYSNFFSTELLPLPKPSVKFWPQEYKEFFGYDKKDYKKYLSDVRSYRYEKIFSKWNDLKPSITVCYSKRFWDEFIILFKLENSVFDEYADLKLRHYKKENIILAPFFGNGALKYDAKVKIKELIDQA